jgi:hypothetical protein
MSSNVRSAYRRSFPTPFAAALAAAVAAAALTGCSSATIENIPVAIGGLPTDTPARPLNPGEYPAVHDMPAPRPEPVLSDNDQKRIEDDLAAARDRQESSTGTLPKKKTPAPALVSTPSGTSRDP